MNIFLIIILLIGVVALVGIITDKLEEKKENKEENEAIFRHILRTTSKEQILPPTSSLFSVKLRQLLIQVWKFLGF